MDAELESEVAFELELDFDFGVEVGAGALKVLIQMLSFLRFFTWKFSEDYRHSSHLETDPIYSKDFLVSDPAFHELLAELTKAPVGFIYFDLSANSSTGCFKFLTKEETLVQMLMVFAVQEPLIY